MKTRYYLLLVLLLHTVFANASILHNRLYDQAVDSIYTDLSSVMLKGTVIYIQPFIGNDDGTFVNLLTDTIIHKKRFVISDLDAHDKLFQHALNQEEPTFQNKNKPRLGQFKPARVLISGSAYFSESRVLFFHKSFLHVQIQVDDIEMGTLITKKDLSLEEHNSMPIWWLFLAIIIIWGVFRLVNIHTKGRKSYLLLIIMIVIDALLVLFYFLT